MNTTMLSDRIEKFILELLNQQADDQLLIKRKDVADLLECAPSQVTYVINTRFTPDDRFQVESRRGSRGYIKIAMRSPKNTVSRKPAQPAAKERTEETPKRRETPQVNSIEAIEKGLDGYYKMLLDYEIISQREYRLLYAMTHTMLEYCPESHRKEAAKTMVHRVEWALKGD